MFAAGTALESVMRKLFFNGKNCTSAPMAILTKKIWHRRL